MTKMKTLSITAIKHSGAVENWLDFSEADLIKLAQDFKSQWILNQGWEPDAIGIDEALDALLHDYARWTISEV
jgi:hypothetical protein